MFEEVAVEQPSPRLPQSGCHSRRDHLFGLTADRRTERALIKEFEERIDQLVPTLNDGNVDQMREIFASYMDIRGYGPVKDAAIEEVRERFAGRISK